MPRVHMTLDISGAKTIANPSDANIQNALAGLDDNPQDGFVILGPDDMIYIQVSGCSNTGF